MGNLPDVQMKCQSFLRTFNLASLDPFLLPETDKGKADVTFPAAGTKTQFLIFTELLVFQT